LGSSQPYIMFFLLPDSVKMLLMSLTKLRMKKLPALIKKMKMTDNKGN